MYNQILQQQNLGSNSSGMGRRYILPETLSESKFISQACVLEKYRTERVKVKRFEQQERKKDEKYMIRGSSEEYIQELTVQSEELEPVECCATMLRLTGVAAAWMQDGTTHRMGVSAVLHRPAGSPARSQQVASSWQRLTEHPAHHAAESEKLPTGTDYREVAESPSTRKGVLDRTERGSSSRWDRKVPFHTGMALWVAPL